ncbi:MULTISPECIES: stress protein [Bacillus]|uniref:stress protein n=1 Tax=Bacillus TaxID=1386 RepID=UPI000BB7C76F|nr:MULTISPECIES: stress protein [Bacillus]
MFQNKLRKALEEQRAYYTKQLLSIGVYDNLILNRMTTAELKEEYTYFYRDTPSLKKGELRKQSS